MVSPAQRRSSAKATRKSILQAARQLFAQQGFDGTSISQIAHSAQINQSLIYHHFGNKAQLWQQVKQDVLQNYCRMEAMDLDKLLRCESLSDFIRLLVTVRFELYDKNPDLQRMINWQRLESNPNQRVSIREEAYNELVEKIITFQQAGIVQKKLDPHCVIMLILNSAVGFFSEAYPLMLQATEAEQAALKQNYLALVVDSLVVGLQAKQEAN